MKRKKFRWWIIPVAIVGLVAVLAVVLEIITLGNPIRPVFAETAHSADVRIVESASPSVTGQIVNERGTGIPALIRVFDAKNHRRWIDIVAQGYTDRDGNFSFPAAPGSYKLHVYKGSEYEYFILDITVADGKDTLCTVRLERIVNMAERGWFAGDVHQHSTYSDGANTVEEMALADVAMGLHFAVQTDHNTVEQNIPFLEACEGLDSDSGFGFLGIAGDEITTKAGHMNIWDPRDTADNYIHIDHTGPVLGSPFTDRKAAMTEIVTQMQQCGMLSVMNHPFAGDKKRQVEDGAPQSDTFLDDDLNWVDNRDLLLMYDATEVWNGGTGFLDTMYYFGSPAEHPFEGMEKVFDQWYRLLNTGAHFPSVGSSDCHEMLGANYVEGYNTLVTEVKNNFLGFLPPVPVKAACDLMGLEGGLIYQSLDEVEYALENTAILPGVPRNYVYTGGVLTEEAVAQAIKDGKSFITSGPILLAKIDGRMPGETAPAGNESSSISLDILSNKPLAKLMVIADGELLKKIDLKDVTEYTGDVAVDLTGRKWVIVYVEGHNNYAYAYTNPIYLAE